jgi:hypothetical protein
MSLLFANPLTVESIDGSREISELATFQCETNEFLKGMKKITVS